MVMSMRTGVELGSELVPDEEWFSMAWMKVCGVPPIFICCAQAREAAASSERIAQTFFTRGL